MVPFTIKLVMRTIRLPEAPRWIPALRNAVLPDSFYRTGLWWQWQASPRPCLQSESVWLSPPARIRTRRVYVSSDDCGLLHRWLRLPEHSVDKWSRFTGLRCKRKGQQRTAPVIIMRKTAKDYLGPESATTLYFQSYYCISSWIWYYLLLPIDYIKNRPGCQRKKM